jgi:YidC/Oxa1 family membrane protein insertase
MPILFGLYAALVAVGPMLENAAFYWIPDLSFPRYSMGGGLMPTWITDLWQAGEYGLLITYLVLPVLLIVTQFIMQKWMTPTPATGGDDSAAKTTQNMTLIMTFMFGFFTLQVPAGLTLYWVTSNLLQMLQQWAVTRFFTKPSAAAATAGGAVVVDSKATKVTPASNGAGTKVDAKTGTNPSANPSTAGAARPAASGAPSSAKTGKPSNRPKAKGK